MDNPTFGKIVKDILKAEGMTQVDLSKKIHVSPSTLNGYINDVRMPPYPILILIAKVLNVSCDYLLGNTNLKISEEDKLSDTEKNIIMQYRRTTAFRKKIVEGIVIYVSQM